MSERPEPYLWLAYDDVLEEPIWLLPLESQADSSVWDDDDVEIHIVTWSSHMDTEPDQLWECNFCHRTTTTESWNDGLPHGRCSECGGDSWSILTDTERESNE